MNRETGDLIKVVVVKESYPQHWLRKEYTGTLIREKNSFMEILNEGQVSKIFKKCIFSMENLTKDLLWK